MSIDRIRRWLQPADTLRWHPWAPLLVLVLALGFAFAFGAKVGYGAARSVERDHWLSTAAMAKARIEDQQKGGMRTAIWDSNSIDNIVRQWAARVGAPTPAWFRLRERFDRAMIYGWWTWSRDDAFMERTARDLAEFRLAHLAGNAPAWRPTSAYCDSGYAPVRPVEVSHLYAPLADSYSMLLGRTVTAAQLAPAVPGGRCPGKELP